MKVLIVSALLVLAVTARTYRQPVSYEAADSYQEADTYGAAQGDDSYGMGDVDMSLPEESDSYNNRGSGKYRHSSLQPPLRTNGMSHW